MASNSLNGQQATIRWYESEIPIRGYVFDLESIRLAYRDLSEIVRSDGERIIALIKKPDDKSDAEFAEEMAELHKNAFKITVSIIGGDDHITCYGEDETIFLNPNLEYPIKTIFFTNENAYKAISNGSLPKNRFSVWINFEKPPLFDPNPLISEPTRNSSNAVIKSEDISFFRSVKNVIDSKIKNKKSSYAKIHEKFSYDFGMWAFWIPYLLYNITIYMNKYAPSEGPLSAYRPALFIYGCGLGLILYRFLFGYLKWAFPVNTLLSNRDTATRHRWLFGAILLAILGNGMSKLFGL